MSTPTPAIDQVRAAWDAIAPGFDEYITPTSIREGEQILARLDITDGTRLLDVACGSGALAVPAARLGAEVTAVDISPRFIELLGERSRAAGVRVDGQVMDYHALDLPDDTFDATVSQHGVTMTPDITRALSEMARVTRAGGSVLVAAFGPLPKVEFLSTFIACVRAAVPGFATVPMAQPLPPFQLADPDVFARAFTRAGLHEVRIDTVTWEIPVGSGTDWWNEVTSSNPIGAQLVDGLDQAQRADVLVRLDGVLRERFDRQPDNVLHAAVNVGIGTV